MKMTVADENPYTRFRTESASELLVTLQQRYGMAMEAYIGDPRPENWRRLVGEHVTHRLAVYCEGETE